MKGRQITLAPAGFTDPDARPSDIYTTDAKRFGRLPIRYEPYHFPVLCRWDCSPTLLGLREDWHTKHRASI